MSRYFIILFFMLIVYIMEIFNIILLLVILFLFMSSTENFVYGLHTNKKECNKGFGCPCNQHCYKDVNAYRGVVSYPYCRY